MGATHRIRYNPLDQQELRETLIGLSEGEMRANAKRSDDELLPPRISENSLPAQRTEGPKLAVKRP